MILDSDAISAYSLQPYRCARGCGRTFPTEKGASRHANSSFRCISASKHFRKNWYRSIVRVKKHYTCSFRRYVNTKHSEESSEVASDEEYGLPPAPEDVIMDADFSTVDAEWCCFAKEELITARNAEGPPCCDVAELD